MTASKNVLYVSVPNATIQLRLHMAIIIIRFGILAAILNLCKLYKVIQI